MIDRYQLRYFLAVVECGNFSRAAAQVNVTQPTLSAGIAKMERDLEGAVFLRNSQRVELTEAGARLLQHARAIEREFLLLDQQAGERKTPHRVRLGVLSTVPTALVEQIVRRRRIDAGPGGLEIVEGVERELLARLERGRIDLALTLLRGPAHPAEDVLLDEGYALAVPSDHPLATADQIPARAIAHEVMIVRRACEVLSETSRFFIEQGVRPAFSFRSQSDDKVLALVRAGLGITLMPQSYRDPGLARPGLAGFDLRRRIGLVFAPHAQPPGPTIAAVAETVRSVLQAQPEPPPQPLIGKV